MDANEIGIYSHPRNQCLISGIEQLCSKLGIQYERQVRKLSLADQVEFQQTVGQLETPKLPAFPMYPKYLVINCGYMIHSCPALVHNTSGVAFAIRIGSYVSLIRLPPEPAADALKSGAVWRSIPLPALRELDIAGLFGTDWFVINVLHRDADTLVQRAYESD